MMLIDFFGRNFGSFRDEFHLSMLAADIDPGNERGIVEVTLEGEEEPLRLLRCAAIYGANASGKSTLLRATSALEHLLHMSARFPSDEPLDPFEPFLLDEVSQNRPVMLGIRAVIDRRVYEYVIEFDQTRFLVEKLTEITPDDAHVLFERCGGDIDGPWITDEQFRLLARSFRPNALLLSLADRLAPRLASGLAVGFRRLLRYHDPTRTGWPSHFGVRNVASRVADETGFGSALLEWLRDADFGIVGYDVKEIAGASGSSNEAEDGTAVAHRLPDRRLVFSHGGARGPVKFDYWRESMGTRRMVELIPFLHDLTHASQAQAYFIDEIGASLHPQLLQGSVRRFNCDTRPENVRGQLIFTTHETLMLDAEAKDAVLRRDQVYLTEKDSSGASRVYSVAEFKERNNLNLRRRYLQGRYGALPSLGGFGG